MALFGDQFEQLATLAAQTATGSATRFYGESSRPDHGLVMDLPAILGVARMRAVHGDAVVVPAEDESHISGAIERLVPAAAVVRASGVWWTATTHALNFSRSTVHPAANARIPPSSSGPSMLALRVSTVMYSGRLGSSFRAPTNSPTARRLLIGTRVGVVQLELVPIDGQAGFQRHCAHAASIRAFAPNGPSA